MSQILFGEHVHVLSHRKNNMEIINHCDHYHGWVPMQDFKPSTYVPTHKISNLASWLYEKPDLKSKPLNLLSMGSPIKVEGQTADRFIKTSSGWITASHIKPVANTDQNIMGYAEKWLGVPYVWGGRSATGIDCSGLVQICLFLTGLCCHRDSDLQFETIGRHLGPEEIPQRGDLAFFPGHVGFMIDKKTILHANATHMAVTIDPLDDVIKWVKNELSPQKNTKPFLGFKRLD